MWKKKIREGKMSKAKPQKKVTPFYFGGLASCMAAVCTHPIDTIKVRKRSGSL